MGVGGDDHDQVERQAAKEEGMAKRMDYLWNSNSKYRVHCN